MKAILGCTPLLAAAAVAGGVVVHDRLVLGVDYYPEQWPLERMVEDMRSIKEDLGANTIRVGEFMWSALEPFDGTFNFTLLDLIVDNAEAAGLNVMLGTPTATMPAWLATDHGAEVLRQGPDSPEGYVGAFAGFGGRRQYSFCSDIYRAYASRITAAVADRCDSNSYRADKSPPPLYPPF